MPRNSDFRCDEMLAMVARLRNDISDNALPDDVLYNQLIKISATVPMSVECARRVASMQETMNVGETDTTSQEDDADEKTEEDVDEQVVSRHNNETLLDELEQEPLDSAVFDLTAESDESTTDSLEHDAADDDEIDGEIAELWDSVEGQLRSPQTDKIPKHVSRIPLISPPQNANLFFTPM